MSGLSKIAGLPQMKLGWIVASGPDQRRGARRAGADRGHLSLGLHAGAGRAAPVARAFRAASWSRFASARPQTSPDCAKPMLGSAATLLRTEGGWYAVLQVPRTRTEEEWTLKLLSESNVLVQPGFFFDFESEAFLVLSLLPEPPMFAEGVSRLRSII